MIKSRFAKIYAKMFFHKNQLNANSIQNTIQTQISHIKNTKRNTNATHTTANKRDSIKSDLSPI